MRLLSYNIHKGIGGHDWRYRLERVCQVIQEQQADLVCLQEVTWQARRTRGHDQPHILARHFDAHDACFQINVRYRRGGYGNLVLSRWPIRLRHDLSLRMNRRRPRGAQLVVVDTPQGGLLLTNWHLGLGERERHWQTALLLRHASFRSSAHMPTLIVGDFNDWRNTLARGPFAEHAFGHVTGPPRYFRSFPAMMPVLSLDKAFYRGGVLVRHARVVRTPLTRRASDHLPLVIDFQLGNSVLSTGY
jgi:endonuclease/exonuclease/phosphatase family metal-dependent hydrolase